MTGCGTKLCSSCPPQPFLLQAQLHFSVATCGASLTQGVRGRCSHRIPALFPPTLTQGAEDSPTSCQVFCSLPQLSWASPEASLGWGLSGAGPGVGRGGRLSQALLPSSSQFLVSEAEKISATCPPYSQDP